MGRNSTYEKYNGDITKMLIDNCELVNECLIWKRGKSTTIPLVCWRPHQPSVQQEVRRIVYSYFVEPLRDNDKIIMTCREVKCCNPEHMLKLPPLRNMMVSRHLDHCVIPR